MPKRSCSELPASSSHCEISSLIELQMSSLLLPTEAFAPLEQSFIHFSKSSCRFWQALADEEIIKLIYSFPRYYKTAAENDVINDSNEVWSWQLYPQISRMHPAIINQSVFVCSLFRTKVPICGLIKAHPYT